MSDDLEDKLREGGVLTPKQKFGGQVGQAAILLLAGQIATRKIKIMHKEAEKARLESLKRRTKDQTIDPLPDKNAKRDTPISRQERRQTERLQKKGRST